MSVGDNLFIEGNDESEFNGSFSVDKVISSREISIKLRNVAATAISAFSAIDIYTKHPVLQMFYNHKYQFMLGDPSLEGYFLSFSKDNLFKLEYSFNSIQRVGTAVFRAGSDPEPYVQLTVNSEVTNISYYFDPSRTGADSPVGVGTYLDVIRSPYNGDFTITRLAGATITTGATIFKFPLFNETESNASASRVSYTTSSKATRPIGDIRLINGGGFYHKKLPVISGIVSNRKIERVDIAEPVPNMRLENILVLILLEMVKVVKLILQLKMERMMMETPLPGQISEVTVTDPGKNYTTATIDIESIPGILWA